MLDLVAIERSTFEELQTGFDRFISQLDAMADKETDRKMGQWLDNRGVCKRLSISPRTLQTLRDNGTLAYSQIERKIYYKVEDVDSILHLVEDRKKNAYWREQDKKKRQGKQ